MVTEKMGGCGFIRVHPVDDPGHLVWFDIHMHRIFELDEAGVLDALAAMGEVKSAQIQQEEAGAGEPEVQSGPEGLLGL